MLEIERKFLIKSQDFRSEVTRSIRITQGYFNTESPRSVRIRTTDENGFLTIKGPRNASGLSRFEWEKEISISDAAELFELCEPGRVEKIRHLVPAGPHTYEIDEFFGDSEGLYIAELELETERQAFFKPDWLGAEVTGDARYYNSQLLKNPYKIWKPQAG